MNLNNLTDNELIDYVIKYDEDPTRVRLATHMERVSGAIMDDLERYGMDTTWCQFTSIVNDCQYHPGQYINHLEGEIVYLQGKNNDLHRELADLKARTVMDLIAELKQEIKTAEYKTEQAVKDRDMAIEKMEKAEHKLDMWRILNR